MKTSEVESSRVFVVIMKRYGEEDGHNYLVGAYSCLAIAYIEGATTAFYRADKYVPFIYECKVDDMAIKVSIETALQFAKMRYPEKFNNRNEILGVTEHEYE